MRVPRSLAASLAILALAACSDATGPTAHDDPEMLQDWEPSLDVVSEVPEVCGASTEVGLMLGDGLRTGTVTVSNDDEVGSIGV